MRQLFVSLSFFVLPLKVDADVLDEYFTRAAAHGFSGSVLIAHGDHVVLRKGYGFADKQRGTPATPETAFDIASLDKQFLAAGILRLEEMGKLHVGDTIDRFFDFVPADKKQITLHQVLSHTAGFPDEYWDEHPGATRAEFLRGVMQKPLIAQPGTRWRYASFDYWLVEEVIERVSGISFEAFLRRELWEPNRMTQTGFALPRWASVAHYTLWTVPSSQLSGGGQFADPLMRPPEWRILLSTVDDLYRWWLALRAGRVLSTESRSKLFTPVRENYAYGWNVTSTSRGTRLIHHGGGGGIGGSVSTIRWFVDDDTFVAILNNSLISSFQSDYVGADVEHLLFGGSGSMLPPAGEQADASKVIGRYRLPGGGVLETIKPKNGPLVARSTDPEAITALTLGGTTGDPLPPDTAAIAKLADPGATTRLYRTFFFNGQPEMQTYLVTQTGKIVRAIRDLSGEIKINAQRMPPGIEVVLAPSPTGGWTTWDFRLGAAVAVTLDSAGRLHLRGAAGDVMAVPVRPDN